MGIDHEPLRNLEHERKSLFPSHMINNPLWVHGTKADSLNGILQDGLNSPSYNVSPDQHTLARDPSFSDFHRYTGGLDGSLVLFHVQPGDLATNTDPYARIAMIDPFGNRNIPPDRIVLTIPAGNFDRDFIRDVDSKVRTALTQHIHLADAGLDQTIASVEQMLRNRATFMDRDKAEDNRFIRQIAQEIVWNQTFIWLQHVSQPIREQLTVITKMYSASQRPRYISEINQALGHLSDDTQNLLINKNTFINTVKTLQNLPTQEGAGCEDVNFLPSFKSSELNELIQWLESLPESW
jgi:hypothetical protein